MPSAAPDWAQAFLHMHTVALSCAAMNACRHLLLLAGSGEARAIAKGLQTNSQWRVTASLVRPPRDGQGLDTPMRFGALDDVSALETFVRAHDVDAILDATHPFSQSMSRTAARVARALQLPHAQVLRRPWTMRSDAWVQVRDVRGAAARLQPDQRVFTNIGQDGLADLSRSGATIFARRLGAETGGADIENVTYIFGKAPFSIAEELDLFQRLNIDVLVTKNTGSMAAQSKLDAALALELPVVLIAPPDPADQSALQTAQDALDWVASL